VTRCCKTWNQQNQRQKKKKCPPGPQSLCQRCFIMQLHQKRVQHLAPHIQGQRFSSFSSIFQLAHAPLRSRILEELWSNEGHRQSLYPENTFMANRVQLMRQDGWGQCHSHYSRSVRQHFANETMKAKLEEKRTRFNLVWDKREAEKHQEVVLNTMGFTQDSIPWLIDCTLLWSWCEPNYCCAFEFYQYKVNIFPSQMYSL